MSISDFTDLEAIWTMILSQLRLEMTQATYNTWLAGSSLVSLDSERMVIGVRDEKAVEWLGQRLWRAIKRVAESVLERPMRVEFVVIPDGGPATADRQAERGQSQGMSRLVEVNHALAGFNQYTHYLIRFWRAYIGAVAFDTWQYVRSFCKDSSLVWTPVRDFTGSELARGADCGRQRITGVWRGCPHFDRVLLEEGRELKRCCRQYEFREAGEWPGRTKETAEYPEGRPTCRHWVHGALEILQAEGLMVYQKRGDQPRNTFYSIQVYQHPPVLTPRQAERFDNKLRIDHRRMLYGLLKAHQAQNGQWHYGLEQWEREQIYSGLAVVPREEALAGLELPLPEEGVFGASAPKKINYIFFGCLSSANERMGTAEG